MIKINDTFEIEKDPYCWNLHEWRDGINRTTGKTTRTKKTTYYNSLVHVCGIIVDKSAGIACNQAEIMVAAIKKAKWDIFKAISCTDMKKENVDNIHKEDVDKFIRKRSRSRYTKS